MLFCSGTNQFNLNEPTCCGTKFETMSQTPILPSSASLSPSHHIKFQHDQDKCFLERGFQQIWYFFSKFSALLNHPQYHTFLTPPPITSPLKSLIFSPQNIWRLPLSSNFIQQLIALGFPSTRWQLWFGTEDQTSCIELVELDLPILAHWESQRLWLFHFPFYT